MASERVASEPVRWRVQPNRSPARHPAGKVAEVTVYFWIVKVLSTAMGEATSDYLVHRLIPVIAVILAAMVQPRPMSSP